jgi:hypothetical protein
MKTEVRVLRGLLRGRQGWISGTLEDRRARGVTKAIVHSGREVEMLLIDSLRLDDQPGLFPLDAQDQPNRPPHPDRDGRHRARRDRLGRG